MFLLQAILMFADAAEPAKPATEPSAPGLAAFVPLILIFVVFYFLVILPGQRRDKKMREAINSALKKNAEVVTSGGIIGVVSSIKEGTDEVVLKIDDNVKMRVLRSAIIRVNAPGANEANKPNEAIKPAT
jgi:preprotein translocase subunit YajC